MILPPRRRFLLGAGALVAAPSIVRAQSLMPVSVVKPPNFGQSPAADSLEVQRWLQMVMRELERRLVPPRIDYGFGVFGTMKLPPLSAEVLDRAADLTRRVLESDALRPEARKWFALAVR